ncbi:hypothetical protein pb186bvf_016628 [Paramecium bursaria]
MSITDRMAFSQFFTQGLIFSRIYCQLCQRLYRLRTLNINIIREKRTIKTKACLKINLLNLTCKYEYLFQLQYYLQYFNPKILETNQEQQTQQLFQNRGFMEINRGLAFQKLYFYTIKGQNSCKQNFFYWIKLYFYLCISNCIQYQIRARIEFSYS